jgi:hypothetical protein
LSRTPCKLCKVCEEKTAKTQKTRSRTMNTITSASAARSLRPGPSFFAFYAILAVKQFPSPSINSQLSTIPSSPPANRRAPPEPRWGERTREPSLRFIPLRTPPSALDPLPRGEISRNTRNTVALQPHGIGPGRNISRNNP